MTGKLTKTAICCLVLRCSFKRFFSRLEFGGVRRYFHAGGTISGDSANLRTLLTDQHYLYSGALLG
jgi:hypothetical protein